MSFERAADAVVDGDVASLQAFLRADPGLIRARSGLGATLLTYVAANGVEDARQRTPSNIVEIAQALLRAGADPNARTNDGWSVLELVVSSVFPARAGVQSALAELLVAAGAELGKALRTAVQFGYTAAAETLARLGAGVDDAIIAAALGRVDLLATMELGGALISASMHTQAESVRYLLSRGVALDEQDNQGFTALHWASFKGHQQIIAALLQAGAPLELENHYGGTVLDATVWAARHAWGGTQYAPVITQLLAAGADAERVTPFPTGDKELDALLSATRKPA